MTTKCDRSMSCVGVFLGAYVGQIIYFFINVESSVADTCSTSTFRGTWKITYTGLEGRAGQGVYSDQLSRLYTCMYSIIDKQQAWHFSILRHTMILTSFILVKIRFTKKNIPDVCIAELCFMMYSLVYLRWGKLSTSQKWQIPAWKKFCDGL